ncbi:OmpA family protein [Spirochaeta dissipatitropha]
MNTSIGVKITHPRYDYARLSLLNRAQDRTRHFMTLSPGQKEADVEIHLIRKTADLEYRSLKILHHFHLKNLPIEQDKAISLSIRSRYDGYRNARIDILYQNQLLDSAMLSIRPDRTVPWLIPLAAVLLLIVLIGGGTAIFRGLGRPMRRNTEYAVALQSAVTRDAPPAQERPSAQESQVEPEVLVEPVGPAEAHEEPKDPQALTTDEADPDSQSGIVEEASPAPVFDHIYIIYFSPNQTYITADAEEILTSLADKLQQSDQVRISAEGHTADYGNYEEQLEISRLRVINTLEFLTDAGWTPEGKADTAWYGPNYPVTRDRERQHENRRVEIKISTEPEN